MTVRLVVFFCFSLLVLDPPAFAEPIYLPGTQPEELAVPLESVDLCRSCHGEYDSDDDYEPWDSWRASAMAQATRDPVFQAALAVAERDLVDAGEYCLRCHTPDGWLAGRARPGDGSGLDPALDYEGITCDACHRMEAGTDRDPLAPYLANAQYFIDPERRKHGKFDDSPVVGHENFVDPFTTSAELCGTCHHVGNPATDFVTPTGEALDEPFPFETTYLEWAESAFAEREQTCSECHMPLAFGVRISAIESGPLRPHDFRRHYFVGSNAWLGRAVSAAYPALGLEAAFEAHADRTREFLRSAATVEVTSFPAQIRASEPFDLVVRVTNLAGHKLPTGYADGRRMWLEVALGDEVLTCRYDETTAELVVDEACRVWRAEHGDADGPTDHLMRQDRVVFDNRIPPEGHVPSARTEPVGAAFEGNRDDVAMTLVLPEDLPETLSGEVTLRVRLRHQVLSRDYVEFLRDEGITDDPDDEDPGERLFHIWNETGRAPPEEIAAAEVAVDVASASVPGAFLPRGSGCRACPGGGPGAHAALSILLALGLLRLGFTRRRCCLRAGTARRRRSPWPRECTPRPRRDAPPDGRRSRRRSRTPGRRGQGTVLPLPRRCARRWRRRDPLPRRTRRGRETASRQPVYPPAASQPCMCGTQ